MKTGAKYEIHKNDFLSVAAFLYTGLILKLLNPVSELLVKNALLFFSLSRI